MWVVPSPNEKFSSTPAKQTPPPSVSVSSLSQTTLKHPRCPGHVLVVKDIGKSAIVSLIGPNDQYVFTGKSVEYIKDMLSLFSKTLTIMEKQDAEDDSLTAQR